MAGLETTFEEVKLRLDGQNWKLLETWPQKVAAYKAPEFVFKVRDKELRLQTHTTSLSGSADSEGEFAALHGLG